MSEAGTSRYADPEADGIIEVCRTGKYVSEAVGKKLGHKKVM